LKFCLLSLGGSFMGLIKESAKPLAWFLFPGRPSCFPGFFSPGG
jgi:hypothetical protein